MVDLYDSDLIRRTFRHLLLRGTLLAAGVSLAHTALFLQYGHPAWRYALLYALACLALRPLLALRHPFPVFLTGTLLEFALLTAQLVFMTQQLGRDSALHLLFLPMLTVVTMSGRIGLPSKLLVVTGLTLGLVLLDLAAAPPGLGPPADPRMLQWLRAMNLAVSAVATFSISLHYFALVARQQRQLLDMATKDALTGLFNRRHINDAGAQLLEHSRRYGLPLSIALCDLDHFKSINDRHGHDAGDAVLRYLASVLRSTVRSSDVVGRWGGEEFVLLLPHTDRTAASALLERCRQRMAGAQIPVESASLAVTMTIGVVTAQPQESLEQAISRADAALYAGKAAGRNQVVAH
ncbi:MAG: GGDEF domain-containing protein [Rhodoferax sp.]